jgi:hypothetical protein
MLIATHGRTSKKRRHNRSRKVRRKNQQQQALGEPKENAWEAKEPPKNDDEDRASDDSENAIRPGPMLSDSESESESESSTDKMANAKSKAIHARDHWKREQEKRQKGSSKIEKTTSQRKSFCRGFACRREYCSTKKCSSNNRY